MSKLQLHALTCPQCGAPGVVRRGTRITNCERCGARLCLTEVATSKYRVAGELDAAGAAARGHAWMKLRGSSGNLGRPELILVPYHEVSALRVGVFERKVPKRVRRQRSSYSSGAGSGFETVESWVYAEKEDTKVMIADVQHLAPAARTPWNLKMFDAREARRSAHLEPFDLVEAQRRATVFAEEETASAAAGRRFSEGNSQVVALARRTLFFPFFSIPVEMPSGSFEIVIDGILGNVVAWRLPHSYPQTAMNWALAGIPGAFALGYGIKAITLGAAPAPAPAPIVDPFLALVVGAIATAAALWMSNRPDWALKSWPDPDR